MKKFGKSVALAIALTSTTILSAHVANAASSQRYESTLQVPAGAVKINVTLGEDLAYRADHVSEDIADRSRSRGLRNGFSGRGIYGQRDLDRLTERLHRKIAVQFEKKGIAVSDDATTVLNIMITDTDPNRPTFAQLGSNPSQSFQSFGIGGAAFEGTLTSGDQEMGNVSYAWFETDIRDASYGGTWSDANRAIDRFARKLAKNLSSNLSN